MEYGEPQGMDTQAVHIPREFSGVESVPNKSGATRMPCNVNRFHSHLSDEDEIDIEHLPRGEGRFYIPHAARLSPNELGRFGERIAWRFLADHGWEMIARNVRSKFGEIDIVARTRPGGIAIRCVEVKTRITDEGQTAAYTVLPRQIRNMRRTFIDWSKRSGVYWEDCLCDAVCIDVIHDWAYISYYGGVDVDAVCAG